MNKIVVLYPEPADRVAFEDYYVNKHLPLAARLPGLKAARYSFRVSGLGDSGTGSPYFAVFEGDFATQADMAAAVASPKARPF